MGERVANPLRAVAAIAAVWLALILVTCAFVALGIIDVAHRGW